MRGYNSYKRTYNFDFKYLKLACGMITNKKNTTFLNSLYMDFLTENELELFLKSLDEIWTTELYAKLKQNRLIRHVISKVWNKGQHRITQVF